MKMLENKLDARFQLTKLFIARATYYVEPNTELSKDTFKQYDKAFNQVYDLLVNELDVARWVVTDKEDMNMNGLNSDEDDVHIHVKDEVPISEGKTTESEDEVLMG